MKKQTAVEWLVEQVNADCLNSTFIRPELVRDALELEKEQIVDAWLDGVEDICSRKAGQKYYAKAHGDK